MESTAALSKWSDCTARRVILSRTESRRRDQTGRVRTVRFGAVQTGSRSRGESLDSSPYLTFSRRSLIIVRVSLARRPHTCSNTTETWTSSSKSPLCSRTLSDRDLNINPRHSGAHERSSIATSTSSCTTSFSSFIDHNKHNFDDERTTPRTYPTSANSTFDPICEPDTTSSRGETEITC